MIAIKNYVMPRECGTCDFCVNTKSNDYGYFGECFITKEDDINLLKHTRGSKCPLVGLEISQCPLLEVKTVENSKCSLLEAEYGNDDN